MSTLTNSAARVNVSALYFEDMLVKAKRSCKGFG